MAPNPDRVLIFDTTLRDGEQSPGCSMTQPEKLRVARALAELGVDVAALRSTRRPMVRPCLDWTERRPHLAGSAGAALCRQFFRNGWIERTAVDRAVRVTASGRLGLNDVLGISDGDLTPPAQATGSGGRA